MGRVTNHEFQTSLAPNRAKGGTELILKDITVLVYAQLSFEGVSQLPNLCTALCLNLVIEDISGLPSCKIQCPK